MVLVSSSDLFSALPVRDFLGRLGYEPRGTDVKIAMEIIFSGFPAAREARHESHLTHSTDVTEQIRYPLRDRVRRGLRKIAADVRSHCALPRRVYSQVAADDHLSREFFELLGVELLLGAALNPDHLLTSEEMEIADALRSPAANLPALETFARERIYATDYRTAFQILGNIPESLRTDEMRQMFGLCANFFGRTEISEAAFRKLLESANPLVIVNACYMLAMLYLRLHPKEKQSLEISERYLTDAYDLLLSRPDLENVVFHRIFNRNGYALCLYRRGRVEEALEMLRHGIAQLRDRSTGVRKLHQSVLMYNALQCLRTLKRYEDCWDITRELLEIDPLFPEYHLEHGKTLLEQNNIADARSSFLNALDLDADIPETYALIAYTYLSEDDPRRAAEFYRKAVAIDRDSARLRLDLAYCLAEMGERASLEAVLRDLAGMRLSKDEREAWEALNENDLTEVIA